MKDLLNKTFAILLIIMIAGINVLTDVVYASEMINETAEQTSDGTIFSANINGENETVADINDELNLNLNLSLKEDGYLKDIKVSLNNNNFIVSKTADEINEILMPDEEITNVNKIITEIDGNDIYLKEVNSGENLEVKIPIKFNKEETVSKEDLEANTEIIMTATHITGVNKGKEVSETINQHLKWTSDSKVEINQNIVRYLKYDNKTMVSLEIEDGIINNSFPVESKEISIIIPKMNNNAPESVTVVGENIESQQTEDEVLITKVKQSIDDEEYSWDSKDKYTITYIYNEQTDSTTFSNKVTASEHLLTGDIIEDTAENQFEVSSEVGSIVQIEASETSEINKGYMYTNLNRNDNKIDTEYNANYKINIGYADLTDKIVLAEGNTSFYNENGEVLVEDTDKIITKRVIVSQKEITDVLGEDGNIVIKNAKGEEISNLNKNTTEVELADSHISFELSKPQNEGIINIQLDKVIIGDNSFDVNSLVAFRSTQTNVNVKGYKEDLEITNTDTSMKAELKSPTSNASIDTNVDTLSTIIGNTDVVINAVLNTTDVSDALYVNPTIKITLPEEVDNFNLKSAKILYDDELKIEKVEVNGRDIVFTLNGVQTQYNELTTTRGTILTIVADINLNMFAPTNQSKITMEYTNQFTSETGTTEKIIKVAAPNEMIMTNKINIDGQEYTAYKDDVEPILIKAKDSSKTMQISGYVVNNLENDAEGFTILGRIPSTGNKSIGGTDLESNINTSLASPVEITGIEDATIYYSNNIEEYVDSEGWSTEATTDSKSFKIVKNTPFAIKNTVEFKYSVSIPENLEYNGLARENFGVYYNSIVEGKNSKTLSESKTVGIKTGGAPAIDVSISAIDTNEGYAIDNEGTVTEGEYITYRAKVKNTGDVDANNVKVVTKLPETIDIVNYIEIGDSFRDINDYEVDETTKELTSEIGLLKGGEERTVVFTGKINQLLSDVTQESDEGTLIGIDDEGNYISEEEVRIISVNYEVTADIIDGVISKAYSVKNTQGNISIKLTSDTKNATITEDQEIVFMARIENVNFEEKENVTVTFKLPKGFEYKEILTEQQAEYDESNNSVTVNIDSLDELEKEEIKIKVENKSDEATTLKTEAVVNSSNSDEDITSNTVELKNNVINKSIRATHTINTSPNITDSDEVEFYIDIENISDLAQTLTYNYEMPKELLVNRCVINVDDQIVYDVATNYLNSTFTIEPTKSARITVYAKAIPEDLNTTANVNIEPQLVNEFGKQIDINNINIQIQGTSDILSEQETEEGNEENSEIIVEEEINRINGTAWYDENKNGKKDMDEPTLSGIRLKLYNETTKGIVKDENGNEVQTETNENGEYEFSNVKRGKYLIVAQFDYENYQITSYKLDGVAESENSDFIEAMMDEEPIAATNTINTANGNAYNVNLGLSIKDRFELDISNKISKITVNNSEGKKEYKYDGESAKIELSQDDIQNSTLLIEYDIDVTNTGNISGYAKSIISYIPEGLTFNSELNRDWYLSSDGNLYSVSLSTTELNPGESANLKLILVKKISENNLGIVRGKAEIQSTYNERGLQDISALSAKKGKYAAADVVIAKKAKYSVVAIIATCLGVVVLLWIAFINVKKHIDKAYTIEGEK